MLDALLETLGDMIERYLCMIVLILSGILDTAPLKVKVIGGGAVDTAAHANGNTFMPYFEATI